MAFQAVMPHGHASVRLRPRTAVAASCCCSHSIVTNQSINHLCLFTVHSHSGYSRTIILKQENTIDKVNNVKRHSKLNHQSNKAKHQTWRSVVIKASTENSSFRLRLTLVSDGSSFLENIYHDNVM